MRGFVEIRPYKEYGYINLPKDAMITDLTYCSKKERIKVYYQSKSKEIYECDGNFGFEYSIFKNDEDINIVNSMENENRETVYAQILDCDNKKIVIIISKWSKKEQ